MVARREPHQTNTPRTRRSSADDFVTVREAAETLGVSPSTVWRWVDAGKLPALRLGRSAIRIRRRDTERMVRPASRAANVGKGSSMSDTSVRRWTPEERGRVKEFLDASKKLQDRIAARRKDKPLPDSTEIIRQAREERAKRF